LLASSLPRGFFSPPALRGVGACAVVQLSFWAVCVEAGALAAAGVDEGALELLDEFELPQPAATSGTRTTVNISARCRTAGKASDPP
jgi:hypothetical protein